MRIFFSVGEPSGDLHASNLIRRIRDTNPDAHCVGFGGPKMSAAGAEILFDLTSLAVMFLTDAVRNLATFLGLVRQAKNYFRQHPVDAVVLIDYAGFNWWIARQAKRAGIPVFFYGVPQVWAWAPWRLRKIRKYVDHVLCKLPFEADWFAARSCHANYVGHPYFDQLAHQQLDPDILEQVRGGSGDLVLLLPGSRKREVENNLPILLETTNHIKRQCPEARFAIASYDQHQLEMAREIMNREQIELAAFADWTPELMSQARVCIACSGSVSLELLHYRCPTVIVYRVNRRVMWAQRFLLKIRFITLVNLIAAKDIRRTGWSTYDPDAADAEPALMPEYLTAGNPSRRMAQHVVRWLTDESAYETTVKRLDQLANQFAIPGATERAADYILECIGQSRSPASESPQPSRTAAA